MKKLHTPIMTKFLEGCSPEDKKVFLDALSEDERVNFVESVEEFRTIFGRSPKVDFPGDKPDLQSDVNWVGVKEERLRERFEEVMEQFPQKKSIESLRQLKNKKGAPLGLKSVDELRSMSQPKVEVHITLNNLREASKKSK